MSKLLNIKMIILFLILLTGATAIIYQFSISYPKPPNPDYNKSKLDEEAVRFHTQPSFGTTKPKYIIGH